MDRGVCSDMWLVMTGGRIGSHESEHDLAVMVSDFLEDGSGGADSLCSSDSDSGFSDLAHLADTITYCRQSTDQYERNLISVVQSLLLAISMADLKSIPSVDCNACCIRFSLVKLLRLSGYDAAVCSTKWHSRGKVPGGDHEYIDIAHTGRGKTDRFIIDIDFRSHFEIARAIDSYDRILNTLPIVYAGSLAKLEQYLPVMVEAARTSLKQNSMPLPPWRSLAYLQAKWRSPYQRKFTSEGHDLSSNNVSSDHKRCCGHLKRLQSLLQSEIEVERTSKHRNNDTMKLKFDWGRHSSFRTF
uniref:Plant-specific domain TIGR01615 family protein n=1 Tax=Kalanchoe fedtschenkoi TaxID=63787 RepID=A0A7N0V6B1_KALFE